MHYVPIYGQEVLKNIKEADKQKSLICEQMNIKLHVIKATKAFTQKQCERVLKEIRTHIDKLL